MSEPHTEGVFEGPHGTVILRQLEESVPAEGSHSLPHRLSTAWILVTEKVPGRYPVLIYTAAQTYDIAVCQIKYTGAGRPCWERGIYKEFYPPDTVTHWMPLPPPPEPQP